MFRKCLGIVAAVIVVNLYAFRRVPPRRPAESKLNLHKNIVLLGIDILEREQFRLLAGKKIGVLTHDAAVNVEGKRSLDVLAGTVKITTVFCPEHGLAGLIRAGNDVSNGRDDRTGLPVVSLHGKNRSPTPEMLGAIDVLVIDLQDIGSRSYTYISCMRYAVEACFRSGIEVVVLDRPNPLGGLKAAGPSISREQQSYVGAFCIPYVHGMTIGELSQMIVSDTAGHPALPPLTESQRRKGRLTVVPMQGWRRSMTWPDTGLQWRPTSPYIPTFAAAVGYSMVGIGTVAATLTSGCGTPWPFRLIACAPSEVDTLCRQLSAAKIEGVAFVPIHNKNKNLYGAYLRVDDWNACDPGTVIAHLLKNSAQFCGGKTIQLAGSMPAHVLGDMEVLHALKTKGKDLDADYFVRKWRDECLLFLEKRRPYLIYPE